MNLKINKKLLIIKILYFFELSAVSCLFMYLTPFMYEFGVTASELAVINFLGHISSFLSRPILGFLADKFQRYRQIIIISSVFCILLNEVQLVIPKNYSTLNHIFPEGYFLVNDLMTNNKFTMCIANMTAISCWPSILTNCSRNETPIAISPISLVPSNITCNSFQVYQSKRSDDASAIISLCSQMYQYCSKSQVSSIARKFNDSGFTFSTTFFLFAIIKFFAHGLFSAIHSLTDSVTFVTLERDESHKFGITRVFGSLGVLTFSLLTALALYLFDRMSKTSSLPLVANMMKLSQYSPCFILCGLVFIGVIVSSFFLKNDVPIHSDSSWKSFMYIFRNLEISTFLIFAISGGFVTTVLIEYYFLIILHMFHDLPKYFPGLVFSIFTISEMICMGASPFFLNYLSNEFWISITFCVWAIKWLSYLYVTNYWLLIIIELLNGPAFGLMLPCMMSYISKFAEKSNQGRMQSVFSSLFFNVGGALGSLFGGGMLEIHGYRGLFISMSVISIACCIIYYPLQRFIIPKCCSHKHKYETNERVNSSIELVKTEICF